MRREMPLRTPIKSGPFAGQRAIQRIVRIIRAFARHHKIISTLICVFIIAAIVVAILFTIHTNKTTPTHGTNSSYAAKLPQLKEDVTKNPKDATTRTAYAAALYATGDTKEAVNQYQEAVKLNPKDAVAYNNLGNGLRDQKKYDDAVKAYQQSIAISNTSVNTYANLANVQFYYLNDHSAAIATYKKGIGALPDSTELLSLLANAYEVDGNISAAKNTYNQILQKDGNNAGAKAGIERLNQ